MKLRLSTGMTLVLLFALLLALAQWVDYQVSSELLRRAVQEREIDKVKTVSRVVQGLITQQTNRVQMVARMLAISDDVQKGILNAQLRGDKNHTEMLDEAFAQGKLDLLEATDDREIVVHRAQEPARIGDRDTSWGVAEALSGTPMLVGSSSDRGTLVRAVEPLRLRGKIVGTLSAGLVLGEERIKELSTEVGADLALLSRSGRVVASNASVVANLDSAAITEAFQQKAPIYRQDFAAGQTLAYLPVLVIDDAYVMLARIDSSSAYRLLEASYRRAAAFGGLILAASILLLILTLRLVLRPLRQLRRRAERTAIELTGKPIEAKNRDEVTAVVQVLDTLTQRLVGRNQELAQAKLAADAASAAKSQFLSTMSHEIRTPLNGVLGMAELLQRTPLNDEQARYATVITTAGRTLRDLLSDILDLAKIEAGKVRLERTDFSMADLVGDLSSVYRELASARGNLFSSDLDPACDLRVSGDPVRLRQVLTNLLGNAVKFTERGTVALSTRKLEGRAGDQRTWLRFIVRDTGIGMAPEAIDKLFQPFVQADESTTREFGGTGLGLVICKYLVELMGGTIEVESEPGKGSTFRFDLPFEAATLAAPQARANTSVVQRIHARVLVAEDNLINQELISAMLAQLGAQATIVDNGALAVEALRKHRFDIVLMDCQMPVMDGYGATALIRESEPPGRRTPIIALTANAFVEDRSLCMQAGMDDYLAKPVGFATLAEALQRWLADAPVESQTPQTQSGVCGVASSSASAAAPLAKEVIDNLTGQFGEATVTRLMRVYLDAAGPYRDAIVRDAGLGDLPGLRATLHALKSSSKTIGGHLLGELAAEGERLARHNDKSVVALVPSITSALDALLDALSAHPLLDQAMARPGAQEHRELQPN